MKLSKIRRKDLTNLIFGEWKVLDFSHLNSSRSAYWNCKCSCGTIHTVSAQTLQKGQSKRCKGCSARLKTAIYKAADSKKYLYIFKMDTYFKIGVSNDVESRRKLIDRNSPFPCFVHTIYANRDGLEKAIHTGYKSKCIKGEWFKLDIQDLLNIDTYIREYTNAL